MTPHQEFNMYLIDILNTTDKMYYCFLGINKKEYPKWEGWKLIQAYKERKIELKDINDKKLDLLVRTHHCLKFIKMKSQVTEHVK